MKYVSVSLTLLASALVLVSVHLWPRSQWPELVIVDPGWHYHKKADGRRIFEGVITNWTDKRFRHVEIEWDIRADNPMGGQITTIENVGQHQSKAFKDPLAWTVSPHQSHDRAKIVRIRTTEVDTGEGVAANKTAEVVYR